MKSHENKLIDPISDDDEKIKSAYNVQRRYRKDEENIAYKIGGSNKASSNFFGLKNIIVGSVPVSKIFYDEIPMDFPLAEVEIIAEIIILDVNKKKFQILAQYMGIECPEVNIHNPGGDAHVAILDNCSAGSLIIFKDESPLTFKSLTINGLDIFVDFNLLVYSIEEICKNLIETIVKFELPYSSRPIYVATGGISELFELKKNSIITINKK